MDVIGELDHILIADTAGNRRIYKLNGHDPSKNKIVHYKNLIDISQLIGKKYFTHYQIADASNKSGKLIELTNPAHLVSEYFIPLEAIDN
jgi:hypothetical protein